jgi:hypothetical protein
MPSSSSATVTEHLNQRWFERNTGQVVTEVQRRVSSGQALDGGHPGRDG